MSESETDRKLHPDLHPLLLRFQELTGEPLESVWRVYDQQDLDRIILIFPRLALIIKAEPYDDTIKFDLANREDLHTNEYSEMDGDYTPALVELGWFYLNVLDDAKLASGLFEKAVRLQRQDLTEAVVGKAKCLMETESKEAARIYPVDVAGSCLVPSEISKVLEEIESSNI